jgi:hypothetical protein
MTAASVSEDEALHLRVPATGLVPAHPALSADYFISRKLYPNDVFQTGPSESPTTPAAPS